MLSSSPSRSPEPSCAAVDNTEEGEGEEGDDGEEGEGEEGEEMEGMQRLPGTDEGTRIFNPLPPSYIMCCNRSTGLRV